MYNTQERERERESAGSICPARTLTRAGWLSGECIGGGGERRGENVGHARLERYIVVYSIRSLLSTNAAVVASESDYCRRCYTLRDVREEEDGPR